MRAITEKHYLFRLLKPDRSPAFGGALSHNDATSEGEGEEEISGLSGKGTLQLFQMVDVMLGNNSHPVL